MTADNIEIKSFNGGMNKDLNYSVLPENAYIHAENYKLIANDSANGFVLENAEGNRKSIDISVLPDSSVDYVIVGQVYIKPYLVLWVSENKVELQPELTSPRKNSAIIRVRIDGFEVQTADVIYTDSALKGYLDLSGSYPIKAVGVYESQDVVKVYWTDHYNELRFCNIMDSDLDNQTVDRFSMIAEFPTISTTKDTRVEFDKLVGGNITASKVQYTYQYYDLYGNSTNYAPLSRPIAIPIGSPDHFSEYKGAQKDEKTSNGCRIKINVPATKTFDRIRVVALDYTELYSVPRVRVIGEFSLDPNDTSTELYYTDRGQIINEISYSDFLTFGNVIYKPKDLTVKDNMLFISNIKEDVFDVDFDARVYRFNASGSGAVARIYSSNLTDYIEVKDGAGGSYYDYDDVPETHDCINLYNSPDYEGNASYQYKYQANGTTWGAEGKNIKIAFDIEEIDYIDTVGVGSGKNSTYGASVGENPADPYNVAYNMNFQRHEVYRLGIVVFNQKMQASPIKWMCDLKMPNHSDYTNGYRFTSTVSDDTTARLLGITVTMVNEPTDDYYAWQVVMVKRESDDRSVLANGILQTPIGDDYETTPTPSHSFYMPIAGASTYTNYLTTNAELNSDLWGAELMMLISPEINFNKNLVFNSGDFLQYNGSFDYVVGNNSEEIVDNWMAHKLTAYSGGGNYTTATHQSIMTDFKIIDQPSDDTVKSNVGSLVYRNYSDNVGATAEQYGLHGTLGVGYSSSFLEPNNNNDEIMYVSYRRNVFESQYGGLSYYDRQRNEYIGISELKYGESSVTTHEGDTYIGFYWYAKQAIDLADPDDSAFITLLFPVESSIVLGLRHDDVRQLNSDKCLMREQSGYYEATVSSGFLGLTSTNFIYNQELDLYQYNSVYSFFGSGQIYIDELQDSSNKTYFPTKIMYSDTKTIGEQQDSFLKFRSNNFTEVDGNHGPVNNILNFNNGLYYWQDSAFGVLSVNTRSLITDNNPGVLSIGTGGVLDRFDYISRSIGNKNDYGIIASDKFLYWVDNNRSEIIRFSGDTQSISKTDGMQTWINSNGRIGWVTGVYDKKYNDVIFTLHFSRVATCADSSGGYGLEYTINNETGLVKNGTEYNVVLEAEITDDEYYARNSSIIYEPSFLVNWTFNTVVPATDDTYFGPTGEETGSKYYFTLKEVTNDAYTISFNEQLQKFVSFHSFKPTRYFSTDTSFLTTKDGINMYYHNHPSAIRGEYYDVLYDSIITTVFNKHYPYTKVYDNFKWVSESKNSSGINVFKDTFNIVEFYNDYQHSGPRYLYFQEDGPGVSSLYASAIPISRRERTWALAIPRNIVKSSMYDNVDIQDHTNWDETLLYKDRIRDKYMVCKLTYDNTSSNYTFSVPFVSAIFRTSHR